MIMVSSLLLMLSFTSVVSAASLKQQAKLKPTVQLSGEIEQGALVLGKTTNKNKVTFDGKNIPVTNNGNFVFGFSRDDNKTHQLVIVNTQGMQLVKQLTPKKRDYKIQRITGIAKKIMQPNPKAVTHISKDNQQIKKARAIKSDLNAFAQGFIAPNQGKITGVYGSQRYFNGKPKRPHFGLDFAAPTGAIVIAPADGVVTLFVPDMFYSGGTLLIDHGHGISSSFLHLSKSYVKKGDIITQGQKIAEVGSSGRATGPHLDWRINWYEIRLDPALALKVKPIE
ncbi:MAG: M23 family metallopeptidase [Alteromonadaceae bacterium]|nr:M23 family metallopeptidase [Alteromonadaceae bacterium]